MRGNKLIKHPGNERLKQLIREHEARVVLIARALFQERGEKISNGTISRWILGNEESNQLAQKMRKARRHSRSKVKSKPFRTQVKKATPMAARLLPMRTATKPKIVLGEEKLMVLRAKGKSPEEIAEELGMLPRVVESFLRSILIELGVETLEKAREILRSQEGS